MDLELAPLHADPKDLGIENGVRTWGVASRDPAFIAKVPAGSDVLRPGWYRASAILDGRSGDVHAPRIYVPDAAGQYSEERAVAMERVGGRYAAEFHIPFAVNHLRFDPSDTPCEFACDTLHVAPVAGFGRLRHAPARLARILGLGAAVRWARAGMDKALARGRTHVAAARSADRRARVLAGIDRDGVGIEIGPSHAPIAPKREGFRVEVIDHASREELLGKYAQHGLPLENIEEVDHVWRGESYLELTGKPKHYDWIIASHLIEHTPDLIGFLEDCDAILKDGGVLSLVIPDKRYVFDRFRPITGLARVIDAHLARGRIHSAGVVAEYFLNVAAKSHQLAWSAGAPGDYTFIHSAKDARDGIRQVVDNGAYLDVHDWCFVPHSFRLLVNDLYTLGYTKLREASFHPTEGCEFYVTLGRQGTGPNLSRLELLKAIDAELSDPDR